MAKRTPRFLLELKLVQIKYVQLLACRVNLLAGDSLNMFFCYFSQKADFDILCKNILSPQETMCMK